MSAYPPPPQGGYPQQQQYQQQPYPQQPYQQQLTAYDPSKAAASHVPYQPAPPQAAQMQPMHVQQMPPGPPMGAWTTGLCDCTADMVVCCIGMYLPSCLYGELARKNDGRGSCLFPCCLYYWCACFACLFANHKRRLLRNKYGLPEEPCSDCCIHCWCNPCAMCQELREMRIRERWQNWTE